MVVTLAMMLVYSAHADARSPWPASSLYGAAALGLLPRRCASATEEAHRASTPSSTSHFLESLRGVQSIKLFNRQAERQARFMNLVVDAMNADIATRKLDLMFAVLHNGSCSASSAWRSIWVGALLVLDQRFSVGMLFAFLAYKEQFAQRVGAPDRQGGRAARCCGCRASAWPTSCWPSPSRRSPRRRACGTRRRRRLEVRDVALPLLRRRAAGAASAATCAIEPGESVAIVGPSGCGKTTLLKLMLGHPAPTDGEILVGGVDLQQLGLRALARAWSAR